MSGTVQLTVNPLQARNGELYQCGDRVINYLMAVQRLQKRCGR
ncbi:MAG: hypothetical protein ACRC8Y_07310 [Chroococcales cyanobacterium]